ncbi:serine/threonine protein kinase [Streptomyces somaliensis]|uniref:serine/threonine-protein kinase n=1 Tax=Streptomyces somaliensis TaxID=78355 RepID=UPI0020CD686F|nr:serine/threonine-protein kinase [Streptomyces somaliensis]MCP9946871.1 serine/threonine protein kinase [Streptomyces somaliensis]MCP9963509.1 serine/threonine protein kinase [Streptomyces somaliensis]
MKVRPWSTPPDWRLTAQVVAGRYRLDELLGHGGTAEVYRGLDLRLRRPVAVKVFRPDGDGQPEEGFTDEGRLLAQLQHPGLVTVYDSGQEDGRPYLVMQLVEGTTLRRRIAAGPLDPAEVRRIGSALASALAHVHAAHVVHRDVKPSNILLDGSGAPYLTDFGISRLLDSTTRTAAGALVGTAAYVAPEQVLGRGAGPAADVYGLGLVLLECLKGEVEYPGIPLEAAVARLHRPPVIPPDLPGDLAELVAAMTAPDEDDRPDAAACSRALAAAPPDAPGAALPHAAGTAGGGAGTADVTLRSFPAGSRAGGAGRTAGTGTGGGPGARRPVPPARTRHRTDRAVLTAGAVLGVLAVTLTGSIDGRTAEAEGAASRPSRQATTEPVPSPTSRRDPSPSPVAPAPGSPTPAPATAGPPERGGSSAAGHRVSPPGPGWSPAARTARTARTAGRSGKTGDRMTRDVTRPNRRRGR